jgi:hypothetical protein
MKKISLPKHIHETYPHHRPKFLKKVVGVKVKKVKAKYHRIMDWKMDPKGYFIIKVFYEKKVLGARYHTYDAVPHFDIIGTNAQEIVQTIVDQKLISSMQHAADLGLELQKAEIAMQLRLNYVQDSPLDFSKKTKKKESDNLPE